jgi:hypothetical protein
MLNNRKQKHTERLAKNDYVANRTFLSAMWGKEFIPTVASRSLKTLKM